jgi:methyl-accepting chemotaxis protein
MTSAGRQRKVSNMKLTSKFHLAHMGIWLVICIPLVGLLNFLLYLLITQQMNFMDDSLGGAAGGAPETRLWLALGLIVEGLVFSLAFVFLAMNTSHRVAGPYIKLKRTCEQIRDGDRDLRLRFRDYDLLEDVAQAFNQMVEALRAGSGRDRRQ